MKDVKEKLADDNEIQFLKESKSISTVMLFDESYWWLTASSRNLYLFTRLPPFFRYYWHESPGPMAVAHIFAHIIYIICTHFSIEVFTILARMLSIPVVL